jgi:hypothetical protein
MIRHREVGMSVAMTRSLRDRCWERNPRRGTAQPQFLRHRFPIAGGLTFGDVLAHRCLKNNPLLARLLGERLYA